MSNDESVERIVQVQGEEAFKTFFPRDKDFDQYQGIVDQMVTAFEQGQSRSMDGARRVQDILEFFDPDNEKGRSLFFEPPVRDAINHVRARVGVSKFAISKYRRAICEGLPEGHPWHMEPNGSDEEEGEETTTTTKKGKKKDEDPDTLTVEQLTEACLARLRGLDPKKLGDPVDFLNTLAELKDVIEGQSGVVGQYVRQSA